VSNQELAFWLAAFALLFFADWLRAMKAARQSEDFATTRIRSAAQGYVELFGVTRPPDGGMLKAPLSGRSCVWWQYTVSEIIGEEATQQSKQSPHPFYIEDATGRCLIYPHGADLIPSDTKTWQSSKSAALADATGVLDAQFEKVRFRCAESILLPNVRLYVLGEFKTVRKAPHALDRMRERLALWLHDQRKREILDVNRDGKLDDVELEAARRAAMLDARREVGTELGSEDRMVQPADGRPFIIAPRVKPTYVRERQLAGIASLAGFMASTVALMWVLAS
jgi:hypothetical protein